MNEIQILLKLIIGQLFLVMGYLAKDVNLNILNFQLGEILMIIYQLAAIVCFGFAYFQSRKTFQMDE